MELLGVDGGFDVDVRRADLCGLRLGLDGCGGEVVPLPAAEERCGCFVAAHPEQEVAVVVGGVVLCVDLDGCLVVAVDGVGAHEVSFGLAGVPEFDVEFDGVALEAVASAMEWFEVLLDEVSAVAECFGVVSGERHRVVVVLDGPVEGVAAPGAGKVEALCSALECVSFASVGAVAFPIANVLCGHSHFLYLRCADACRWPLAC